MMKRTIALIFAAAVALGLASAPAQANPTTNGWEWGGTKTTSGWEWGGTKTTSGWEWGGTKTTSGWEWGGF